MKLNDQSPSEQINESSSNAGAGKKLVGRLALGFAATAMALLQAGCGGKVMIEDSTEDPSITEDAGVYPDSGTPDSGTPDSGIPDSGIPDSATPDAEDCDFVKVEKSAFPSGNQIVPRGAVNVPWTCWTFANGCKEHFLDQLKVHRYGTGQNSDLKNLVLTDSSGTTIAGPRDFDNGNEIAFYDGFPLAADSKKDICANVDVDMNAVVSGTHALSIDSAQDIALEEDVPVQGAFPIMGDEITISGAQMGTCTVEKAGQLLPIPSGQDQALIGQFTVSCDGEDGAFLNFAITFPTNCNAGNMNNFNLYYDGQSNPIDVIPDQGASDFVVFSADIPVIIENGNMNTFWVMADVNCLPQTVMRSCFASGEDLTIQGLTYGKFMPVINNHDCENNYQEAPVY